MFLVSLFLEQIFHHHMQYLVDQLSPLEVLCNCHSPTLLLYGTWLPERSIKHKQEDQNGSSIAHLSENIVNFHLMLRRARLGEHPRFLPQIIKF